MAEERVSSCQSCGATIYPEHLDTGIAGYAGGQLLCPHCFADANKAADASGDYSAQQDEELSPIAMGDEDDAAAASSGASAIHGFSGDAFGTAAADSVKDAKYARHLNPNASTATRCRTFHTKLNVGAVAFMNDQINTWVDANPDIVIKFSTSTIGVFEGKKADPNLILTVFY